VFVDRHDNDNDAARSDYTVLGNEVNLRHASPIAPNPARSW
jgi:hypothetical protein